MPALSAYPVRLLRGVTTSPSLTQPCRSLEGRPRWTASRPNSCSIMTHHLGNEETSSSFHPPPLASLVGRCEIPLLLRGTIKAALPLEAPGPVLGPGLVPSRGVHQRP